ncbi:bifunctional transcriptional activator/DNA repair enzyme AdaA [Paenibacillus barengoltzii]|jgi:AraC family transcriptional regulator of adaptative response / methylphosphotriester-DNA alkyltransferase methyltransferase|uniref:AraC family transcriptional regulator, regulatory protein of adaptative response / methylphosphotriester-DNA alkyltransferase methyltransferase n=1 Tax=Paenibacillus barengoltzii J12 TaxID=935846 RepID=A0ABY1LUH7_9BACL|nr:bifunctional transcriptional activator/DNA repair enzyme AdaA [Paenibacillus barengoltzii]SME90162.1 AraC family transcriptional regulator, regulatory protein of adaptative response / methylphosphotriester-DNA alkyltransferase methyltransferase [Paenibacillus barengoltzii J12]
MTIHTGSSTYQTANEAQWQAILANDASQDGHFFYAVVTTRIFCRPSCKSRPPKRENVLVFATAEQARAAHFRPCKRCKPEGLRLPDQEWVEQIADYIDRHYPNKLTLEMLAEECHGSPYHLQRTFKRVMQMTPTEYLVRRRIDEAKRALAERESQRTVAEIAREVGIGSAAYLITLSKKMTGITPNEYRKMQTEV